MGFDITGLGALFDFGGKLIDKLFPDPAQKAQATLELTRLQQTGELAKLAAETDLAKGQLAIDQQEAASNSLFVSGWRPAVGWLCGVGLAYATVIDPVSRFIAQVIFHYQGAFPVIDTMLTMQILMGMLGLAGMRSYDKKSGNGNGH